MYHHEAIIGQQRVFRHIVDDIDSRDVINFAHSGYFWSTLTNFRRRIVNADGDHAVSVVFMMFVGLASIGSRRARVLILLVLHKKPANPLLLLMCYSPEDTVWLRGGTHPYPVGLTAWRTALSEPRM
ncbi:MAG: hypothetical protein M1294_16685 [Firmicutes bacterium]|nr:hypothetical protein [Bacillota bacterium]